MLCGKRRRRRSGITIKLAHGSTTLYQKEGIRSLLSLDPVEPIIPLRMLIERGFKVNWSSSGCTIRLEKGPPLACWLRNGCPVMERGSALHLLSVLEAEEDPEGLENEAEALAGCPWNRRVRKRLECSKGIILLLYAGTGAKKWRSLNWRGFEVLTVEILEQSQQDVNLAATWTYLWRLASLGLLRAVVGGPPCRSVSRLRHTSPGPRGRDALRYGLPGLSDSEQALADGDAALVLKQVGLWKRAWDMQPPGLPAPAFLLEFVEDPACYLDGNEAMNMPSFWNFPEMQSLVGVGGLNLAAFDQGALGHPRRKPTKVLTNLGAVLTLHASRGDGFEVLAEAGDERIAQSRTWALWAPQLRERIYEGLVAYLEGFEAGYAAQNVAVKRMSAEEWRHHLQRQHVPFHPVSGKWGWTSPIDG